MSDQQPSTTPDSPTEPPIIPLGPWCIAKIKRKLHQRRTERQKENPQDRFARRTANATVAIAVLAIVAAGVGALQYRTMQGQLNEMQAEQRPWVYAADVEPAGRIILEKDQYAIPLKFTIKNTGHLPAFSVQPKTSAVVLHTGISTMSIRNDVCDKYRKNPIIQSTGATVFADQTVTHGGFTGDDYPRISRKSWDAFSGEKIIVVFGCIDYQFPDQPGHHQSRFSFIAGTRQDQGILARIGLLPADPTSVDIRLIARQHQRRKTSRLIRPSPLAPARRAPNSCHPSRGRRGPPAAQQSCAPTPRGGQVALAP